MKAVRTDTQAYELYLLAKQRMYERTGPTIEAAAELLDKAIAIDPEYAPAYAQRGIAALLLSKGTVTYGEIPRDQSLAQGKLYLDKALQLDPELAEAWAGTGLYYTNLPKSDLAKGIEALQKALAINPGMIDAIQFLRSGELGKVKIARGLCYKRRGSIGPKGEYPVPSQINYDLWLGPAPMAPVTRPNYHYDWHWQWAKRLIKFYADIVLLARRLRNIREFYNYAIYR